ncbi:MAG: carbohydrate ABC transporter permease [Defluviitaleaceae bacterium]|nr:carbohydrate ABC transporter permease [Defluviitaleaceae bacterium]
MVEHSKLDARKKLTIDAVQQQKVNEVVAEVQARKKTWKIQESKGDKVFLFFIYVYLVLALIVTLYPLIFVLSASISEPHYVASGQMVLWPMGVTWEGYQLIFNNSDIWRGYGNTIIYTVLGTLVNLVVTIPAAYALSRPEFYGKKVFMIFIMITMFFGGGIIPTFILIQNLGMRDTIWAIILPGATAVWHILVTRAFFASNIPREMEEAAIMDGCNDFVMFIKIILPLSMPIIAVMALFFGVANWNSWFPALIFLRDRSMWPLQMILRELLVQQNMHSMPEGADAAIAAHRRQQLAQVIRYGVMVVSTVPIIMVYPFLQKYFVKGVLIGSVKG